MTALNTSEIRRFFRIKKEIIIELTKLENWIYSQPETPETKKRKHDLDEVFIKVRQAQYTNPQDRKLIDLLR
jgi:hypothetical protein